MSEPPAFSPLESRPAAGRQAALSAILGTAPDAVVVCDEAWRVLLFNQAAESLFGHPAAAVMGRPVQALIPDAAALGSRTEILGRRADGAEVPLSAALSRTTADDTTLVTIVLREPGETRPAGQAALEALARDHSWLRTLLNTIPDPVWLKDLAGIFTGGNAAFAAAVGIPEDRLAGLTDADLAAPEMAARYRAQDQQVIESGEALRFEEHVSLAWGEVRHLSTVKTPIRDEHGRVVGVLGISRDITAMAEMTAALRKRDREVQLALDAAELGTWRHDLASGLATFDERARVHLGAPEATEPFEQMMRRVHPDDAARVRAAVGGGPGAGPAAASAVACRVLGPTGAERWLTLHVRVNYEGEDGGRRAVSAYGTTQDITERRETEDAVKRFVSGSPAVIYAWRAGPDRITHIWTSGNLEGLTGFTPPATDDALWWTPHVHAEDRERVRAAHASPYAVAHQMLEFRLSRADGREIWIRDEKKLARDARGGPAEIIGSWTDVTARIGLEGQLRQAQKMEAVGRLAGGIAHDFNNLLTVICGTSELILMDMSEDDPLRALVGEVQRAGQRAVGLTRQLLAFSRKQVLEPRTIDLNDIVATIETMLRRLIGEDVTLVTHLARRPVVVQVDPGQIEQVLLNLAVNARDAMPRGGQLTIETGTFEMNADYCQAHPGSRPGQYARLHVRDTGTGMTPEVQARLFEPFFTTKEPGKGTGLGLAMVFGIVKQSDGYVEVATEVGRGSAFTVYLPSLETAATPAAATERGARSAAGGRETLLLVEDEPAVRKLTRRALEGFGYRVLEAAHGAAALALAAAHPDIALLITDVVMPQMSGAQLAEQLTRDYPGLRVLFVSGYIDDAIVRHGVVEGTHSFLQKPFLPVTLAAKVREIIDRR